MKKAWILSYLLSAQRECPGWSESSLGTHAILLVLSWGSSSVSIMHQSFITTTPTHGGAPGIAGKMHQVFTFALSPRCCMSGFFVFAPKYCRLQHCGVKYSSAGLNSGGFTNCLSLQCGTSNRDFLGEKSSPLYSPWVVERCGYNWLVHYIFRAHCIQQLKWKNGFPV